jgi:2,3-bisphosphoglycerate-independent phosphoglycerate mutase
MFSFYLALLPMKKVALIVLDGFGINEKTPAENAITLASPTPTLDSLFTKPYALIEASGKSVGLPEGQMGNSEVGHMTLGTGRILKQPFVALDDLFAEGKFAELTAFQQGIQHVRENNSNLHLIGLFGPGGIHATLNHLQSLIKIIPTDIPTYLQLFTDGRDLAPNSALGLMKDFEQFLLNYPHVKIASLGGRYFAMDRDNNWERVQKSYDEIVFQQSQTTDTPSEYLAKSYDAGVFDEFLLPVSFVEGEAIDSGDSVFYFNFRTDRGREMTQALMVSQFPEKARWYEKWGNGVMTKQLNNLYLATMTKYYKEYDGATFLDERQVEHTLSEILAKHDIRQFHLAETEKFAHVTKFFNAEKEVVYDGQKNLLIPSHKVATFDLDPEMSAQEIMDAFKEQVQNFDFFIINFANGDMVGHTGKMDACLSMVIKLDDIVKQLLELSPEFDVDLLITADHGNCEEMGTAEFPKTSHTTNPVPFWYIKAGEAQGNIKKEGALYDFAPTVLALYGIEKPAEMTGENLIN